jgi:hypothetical protein
MLTIVNRIWRLATGGEGGLYVMGDSVPVLVTD